jgi:hypothetical protein
MTDLLPCPFCGDSAKLRFFGGTVDVECTNCNAKSALFGTQSDGEGKAIAAWNTRALTRLSVTKVNAAELAAGSLGRQSDSQVSDDAVVERLGGALFTLSDRLRASGVLSASDPVHEAYEGVVAAFQAISATNSEAVSELAGCSGIESGPNDAGGMRVVVHFAKPGDETALFHSLSAKLGSRAP